MSIEKALFERLKANVPLVSDRVYGGDAAHQAVGKPYIVFKEENTEREYSHQGYSNLQKTTMQIYCFDTGYEAVKKVAAEVVAALESWRADGVQAPFIRDKRDMYFYDLKLFSSFIMVELWNNS